MRFGCVGAAALASMLAGADAARAEAEPATVPRLRVSLGGGAGFARVIDQEEGEVWGRLDARVASAYGRLEVSLSRRSEFALDVVHGRFTTVHLSEPSYAVYGTVAESASWDGFSLSSTHRFPRLRLAFGAGAVARRYEGVPYGAVATGGLHLHVGRLPAAAVVLRVGSFRSFVVDPLLAALGVAHESARAAAALSCGYARVELPRLGRTRGDDIFDVEDGRGGRRGLQCVLDARVVLTPQLELTFTGHAGRQRPFASLGLAARFGEAPPPRLVRRSRRLAPPSPYGAPVPATDPSAPLRVLPPGAPPAGTLAPP